MAMKSSACFFIIFHFTIGSKDEIYDAQNCGIPQSFNSAQSSMKVRRLAMAEAQFIDAIINEDLSQEKNAILDDDSDFMQSKVMGGRRAGRGELPWAVLLRINTGGLCGGTLVSRRHVITAAHCFWNSSSHHEQGQCSTSDMYPMEVVLDSTEVFVGGTCSLAGRFGCTSSDVGRIYKVASASYSTYFKLGCKGARDIAILQLTEEVPKAINHVCLPFMHKLEEIEDPYLKLRAFGWGRDPLNHFENRAPFLQIADLGTKLPENVCSKKNFFKVKGTFCVRSGDQHSCDGDSGGGVTATIRGRSYLIGVVSEGPDCERVAEARDRHPQVCTDIMYYKKYIKKWIGANRARAIEKPKPVNPPNPSNPISLRIQSPSKVAFQIGPVIGPNWSFVTYINIF